jgi:hypothetical protein
MYDQGYSAAIVAQQLGGKLRQDLINGQPKLGSGQTTGLLKKLIEIPSSQNPEQLLEIELLSVVLNSHPDAGQPNPVPSPKKQPLHPEPRLKKCNNPVMIFHLRKATLAWTYGRTFYPRLRTATIRFTAWSEWLCRIMKTVF